MQMSHFTIYIINERESGVVQQESFCRSSAY